MSSSCEGRASMTPRTPARFRVIRLLSLALIAATSGLSSCYYLKQADYLFGYSRSAVPVERVLEESTTPRHVREFLLEVEQIKRFAEEELGLARNENYTSYVETGNDYLATIVSAAEPLSFTSHLWDYPLVGSAPYRGYYEEEDAITEAKRLKEDGLDVWLRRVDAFSTLGYLRDPLYDYMTDYPVHRLAQLIIHEQTHATLWIKDDSSFNEDLASFVGKAGAARYIQEFYGEDSEELHRMEWEGRDVRRFTQDMFSLRGRLQQLYDEVPPEITRDSPPSDEKERLLRRKEEIMAEYQREFSEGYEERYRTDFYIKFGELKINNAFLELFSIYQGEEELLKKIYREEGEDMRRFLQRIRKERGV